jgi:PAS domain S-box-containing protein
MHHSQTDHLSLPLRVILLEPDPSAARSLKRALRESHARIEAKHYTDCPAAMAEACSGKKPFHAAVVSDTVPDSSGLEFYHDLRSNNAAIATVLLFETGAEDRAAAALFAGVEEVLIRDAAGGYLKLLPSILAKLFNRPIGISGLSPGSLAVVVRSDPESTEYKMAARSLLDSQVFWRVLVENPFQYFLLLDRNTTIQYVNRIAPGIRFRDVIGKQTICDYAAPDDRETTRKHYEKVFRTGEVVHYDSYIPDLDQWYSITAGPVFDGGKIIGASVFARDITEQKKVEHRLIESERRFRKLAESVRDVFYILDFEKTEAVYVSPAYEEIFGRPVEEVYRNAMSWMETVHPDDREWVMADYGNMIRAREAEYSGGDYRIIKPDGEIRWLKNRAFVISEPAGAPTQVVGVVADVTREKEAEQRLRESEQKYRTLINQASDGIMVTDPQGCHVEANEAACNMLGYTRDELLGMKYHELILEKDVAGDGSHLEELDHGTQVIKERRLYRKDGSVVPVEGSYKVLPGGLTQIILRDITERKKAEEALRKIQDELERRVEERSRELRKTLAAFEEAQRLASIGTLAAGIAHEINNPIGSILMAADTALYSLEEAKSKDDAVEAIASVKSEAKRVGQIVKTVLQLSRQEESQKWSRDAAEVAQRARDITRRAAIQNNVHVVLEIESDLPNVVINPTEIEQVFVNVIQNAIEASSPGQTVSVRLVEDGGNVVAYIADKGAGMTQEEVDRIFDPFYTKRQREGGTGLGMSLSYSIVRQHGGKIEVESRPGKGTTVAISLPTEASTSTDGVSGGC